MKVLNMRTNHISNPLGFEMDSVRFSWIVENEEDNSKKQKETRVIVALDDKFENIIFDSGFCSNIDNLSFVPNIKLEARTRYYWKVSVINDLDEKITSHLSWFETSKMDEKWIGKWITPNMDKNLHPILAKKFNIERKVKKARLYISGLGLYEAKINGVRVGDEYFAPGFTSYDFWVQYQTFDVTDMINQGNNSIEIMLGNGWYKGRFGFDGGYTELYGDKFLAIAEIRATLENGEEIVLGTDKDWYSFESPIEFSGIYDGEVYNANKEIKLDTNIDKKDVIETEINTSKFQARLSLPVKIKEERKPIKIIKTPKNETILDFGQNMTGWIRFKVKEKKDTIVSLQYSEIMQDNCFYNENLRTAKAEFNYISDGSERVIEPHFTYFGFRYVKLNNFREDINLDDFTACVIYSDIDQVGSIETSNEDINKLFSNALWGQKGNFLDVPTDCPQRDERMGWTGDAQIFSMTACYNMYSPAFYTKFMKDLREEQLRIDGAVPFIVPMIKPENDPGFVTGRAAAAWSDAATIIPWVLYKHYGDKNLLESQFQTMKDWVDYMRRDDEKTGNKRLWTVGFQFGDWLALDGKDINSPMGGTETSFIASAYYYYSTTILTKAAKVLGKEEIEKEYSVLAKEIKEAINNEYFTLNGRCAINTQTALILALYMDLIYEKNKDRVVNELEKKLLEDGVHLKTGFVGTPYFSHVLSENNLNEYAYTLLLNDDFPSWLFAIKLGATTIWERWNSVLEDGSISGTGMNSLNHYAYGSIVEWMYSKMLGINPMENYPGFKKFILSPKPSNQLRYAKGSFNSPSGLIKSSWEIKENGHLEFKFKIPFDTDAIVKLPNADIENLEINNNEIMNLNIEAKQEDDIVTINLNSGEYTIEYKPRVEYKINYNEKSLIRELFKNKSAREALFKEIPPLRNNELLLSYLNNNVEELYKLPIVSNFVSKDQVDKVVSNLKLL